MDDLTSRLSEREMAELSALADGTLPAERRAEVEARVAASPELRELLDRQRSAVGATRGLARDPTPESLQAGLEARRRASRAGRARRLAPGLAVAGAVAAAAVAIVLVPNGGSAEPTVAAAAGLATQPPSGPAPGPADGSETMLAAEVEGVAFPNLDRRFGWRAVGVRHDALEGRDTTTVFYEKDGRRIGYVIVGGSGLPPPAAGQRTVRDGVEYQTLEVDARPAVTWRRVGRTCVLTGAASRAELITLASWRGGGTLTY